MSNKEVDGDVNSVISEIVDKDILGEQSFIDVDDDIGTGETYTVSKENLQKMKNKKLMFESGYELEQGKRLRVSYQFPVVTNADSDFSNKLSKNTDSTAAGVLEGAGIKNYETFTTSGESGSLLPGNGKIGISDYAETSKMQFSSQLLESGKDLFGYYYNASTGRFVKYDTDKNNEQFSGTANTGDWLNFKLLYEYTYRTYASFKDCDYHGTYVITQKEIPASLLMDTYTGLSHEGNDWVYYNNGKIDTSYTGLYKYNGSWWYVRNGKVDLKSTTLCKYNGSWWFVSGGKVNFGATGLCKYNGVWWYINSGIVSFRTTLCKYNGTWWYIENGKINFNKTTLVKYGSNWYAVAGGKVAWNYSGNFNYNGGTFRVVNGVVKF